MQHWIQLSPYGTFDHPQGKQTITYWDAQRCTSNTQTLRFYIGLKKIPVYIGHPDDPLFQNDKAALDTHVYGHLARLKADANGLWAQIHWTPEGIALIQTQRYWYLSPRWLLSKTDTQTTYHPELLLSIGLTQYPNLPVQAFGEHAISIVQPKRFCTLLQRIRQNAYHAFESACEYRTYRYRCFAKMVWLAWIVGYLASTILKHLAQHLVHQGYTLAKCLHRWLHTHRIISNERNHFSHSSTNRPIFHFYDLPLSWVYNCLSGRSQKWTHHRLCIASHSTKSAIITASNEHLNPSFMDNTDPNYNQPRRCWMMRFFAFCFNAIRCGTLLLLKTILWIVHGIFHCIGFACGLLVHVPQWLFHAIFGEPPSTVPESVEESERRTPKKETEPKTHLIIIYTKKMVQKLAKRYKKILQRKKRLKNKARKAAKRHTIAQKQKTLSTTHRPTHTTKIALGVCTRDPISKDLRQVQSRNEKLRILQFTEKVQERMRTTGESYPEAWHAVHKQCASDQPIASDGHKASPIHSHPVAPVQQENKPW